MLLREEGVRWYTSGGGGSKEDEWPTKHAKRRERRGAKGRRSLLEMRPAFASTSDPSGSRRATNRVTAQEAKTKESWQPSFPSFLPSFLPSSPRKKTRPPLPLVVTNPPLLLSFRENPRMESWSVRRKGTWLEENESRGL